ncbi:uncharacterized protein LOC124868013 isoform X2 [Girardinichthys multiradiatus]|uniref:uncharacterized protein LOC124868013 isoform X2 n=1 Tax=Girardinichthys multiradiatus TaxID=208333 RepID=UPI001FAD75B2|nr:uncharacterized protein LOC124868013 isoform X2 [Girardinichthys multiradiatus]
MDVLQIILVVLCGLVSWSQRSISASMLETTVWRGDNVTLYCDCKVSTGVYIVWFRNCSHQYQPTLVVKTIYREKNREFENIFPRLKFLKNESSNSYDLVIRNVTNSDEGLYYCGTFETKVEKDTNKNILSKKIYIYGNTTRVSLYTGSNFLHPNISRTVEDCGVCWKLLFSVCPAGSVLSALFSSLLVYLLCQKSANTQAEKNRRDTLRQTEETQDENVCYAALEINQPSQRTKRKRTIQISDFSTYSAIKTFHVEENHI